MTANPTPPKPKPTGWGPVSQYVADNLVRLRKARSLSTTRVAAALKEIGHSIPATGITRIEKGERRVDADDLVALGVVLDVSPAVLLLPPAEESDNPVQLAPQKAVPWHAAWRWAHGEQPPFTPGGEDDPRAGRDWPERQRRFLAENQPHRNPDHLREIGRYVSARIDGPWHLELDSNGETEHGSLSLRSERAKRGDRDMTLEDLVAVVAETRGINKTEARIEVYGSLAEREKQEKETGGDQS